MSDLGRQVKYGIGKESVAGTAVAPTNSLNQLKFDMNPMVEYVTNDSAYGVLEKENTSDVNRQSSKGSLEAKLTSDTGGLLLLGAFGSVTTADNADSDASVKDHTFNVNQSINGQTFTLVRKDSLSTMQYALGRFDNWQLTMALDDYVKVSADVLAKVGASTTWSPAFTAEPEFVAKHISVKTASTVSGLSGATAVSTVSSFTLTVNANLQADYQAGSSDPYGFSSQGYDFKFEMECRYNDQTFENAYKNGTTLALQVSAVNSDVTIGSAAHPGLVFTAPKMIITDWARTEDLDKPLSQKMTGTIHYSVADSYALRAVLTNTTASY